ncbi:MAG: hypothetical protein P9L90_03480 [Candidatus Aadella gelida]|nr:hypothetical protein [Candidatus Aadella gelida]
MNKIFIGACTGMILIALTVTCVAEMEHFQIKMGAHEKVINEKYGAPTMEEPLTGGFLPIKKKKALYRIDDENYFIIRYFSGRVKEMNMLEGYDLEDARTNFEKIK